MKKSELKSGMVVESRNGNRYVLIEIFGELTLVRDGGWNYIDNYNEDLNNSIHDLDIVNVYDGIRAGFEEITNVSGSRLLWSRYEKKKMTVSQIEKQLGYEIEIVRED